LFSIAFFRLHLFLCSRASTALGRRFRGWHVHSEVKNQYLSIADVGEKLSILHNPLEKANLHKHIQHISVRGACQQPVYRADDELVAVALNRPWSESGYRSAPANLTITHQAIEKIVRPTGVHVLAIDRPQRLQSRTALTPTWPVEQRRHCTIIVYYNTDNPHLAIIIIIIIFHICIFSYQSINFGGEFIVQILNLLLIPKLKHKTKAISIYRRRIRRSKQRQTKQKSHRHRRQQQKHQHVMQAEQYAYSTIDVEAICEFWQTFDLPALQFLSFSFSTVRVLYFHVLISLVCFMKIFFHCLRDREENKTETPVFICDLELCNPCYNQAQEEANGLMPTPEIHTCNMLQLHLILTMYSFTDEACILAIV
ncbi:hypothetical protein D917_01637, partial [Trichinella nativa]